MNTTNLPTTPLNTERMKPFIGIVLIVAVAAIFYLLFLNDEKVAGISVGGPYIGLAEDHPQGEKFLQIIEDGFAKFSNEDPDDDISGYIDVGFYKNELGDVDGAIEAYKAGLEINENVPLILSNLAHIYEFRKDYKNAEVYYTRLVNTDPTNVRGIVDFASMYKNFFDGKKHNDIISLVQVRGLSDNPNDLNLLSFLATYYRYNIEDLNLAETYYRRILELNPTNAGVQAELRNLLRSQGREL